MKPYNHDIYLNGYKAVTFEGPLRLGTYDSYGNERIRVLCSPEWDGLTIVATFKAASAVEVLVDADGMLDVPPEATATQQAAAGRCALTFVGTGEGRQTISCTTYYLVQDHATVGNVTPDPTPDKWQQFVDQVAADRTAAAAAAKEASRNAQDAKTAESNAKDSADNAAASATAAAGSAHDAARLAEAAAQSATKAQGSADAAANSAETAKTAETGAGSNAAAAKNSADQASASAAAAKESQTAAKASQDAASASASTASGKATDAGNSAAAAATSEKNAAASSAAAKTAQSAAETAKTGAESAKTAADNSAKAAASSASTASGAASTATTQAAAAKSSADNAASSATAAESSKTAAARSAQGATNAETAAKAAQNAAETAKTGADTAESSASEKATAAASSATAAKSSETAAAKSADDAKNYAAQVAGIVTSQAIFGVNFSGSASAGTRVGAAKDFVFTPGTDTSAGQNSFDAVYPWAGMRRCCTLNADGTVKVNAYKGQPGYIEDGTNGEVLVEIPLFYVSGMLDVAPSISMSMLPGYRAPRKFLNADGSLKQKCYVRAFPGSIGTDSKLHSIAGAVPTDGQNITQFLAAARKWGDTYSVGTSADFEVLAYLMIVVYGTRHAQSKINGCVSLYGTNIAIAAATDNAASVVVAKSAGIEPGMVISIGTGDEGETIAKRRIVTSVEAIDGDATNVKVNFDGDPVTTTTDHKVWRIMQSTGTANSVIATCGSPVSNTDGRHSFVFYGVENPLYGNQWRFECDWKLVDGVPYWCDDPTKYSWTSNDGYIALDTMAMPDEGWATALQQDDRAPSVQITKSVGGSSGTYLADYFYINKTGTRIALRGGYSNHGGGAGPFCVTLVYDAGGAWWAVGGDLSIPG